MHRLLISAAEPSGDRLAAELIAALSKQMPIQARGVAGPAMRAAGVEPIARMEDIAVMGLIEVLSHLGTIRRVRTVMEKAIDEGADALVVIDAPDFHLPLANRARAQNIPAIGYVSPQIWAWRPGRARHISASLDKLLCRFSFEPELYPDLDTTWVGHPVVDRLPRRQDPDPNLYGLLPGSRKHELQRMLPVFLETASLIKQRHPEAQFLLACPPQMQDALPALPDHITATNGGVTALKNARAALTKSGTITLELATMGVPQVVAHRVHPLTYWVGRLLVRGIQHIALPNILSKRTAVPEFVQHIPPIELAEAMLALPEHQHVDLSPLGQGGASVKAASIIAEVMR